MWVTLVLAAGAAVPATRAQELSCPGAGPGFNPEALRERLRRHRALTAFAHWRLTELKLAGCAGDGAIAAELALAPPSDGISSRAPYLLRLPIRLDARTGEPRDWRDREAAQLAFAARRVIQRAEQDEDVRRFLERFPPVLAAVAPVNGTGLMQVEYGGAAGKTPRLSFRELPPPVPQKPRNGGSNGGLPPVAIVGYQIPRMDSFPARRELLRFVDELSLRHPACRPTWIQAERQELPAAPGSEPPRPTYRWEIRAELEGKSCPQTFARAVTPDRQVQELPPVLGQ